MSAVDCTISTPGTGPLSLTVLFQVLKGQSSAFLAAITNQYNCTFYRSTKCPSLAEWTEAAWNEKFDLHFYTRPAVGIEPQSF